GGGAAPVLDRGAAATVTRDRGVVVVGRAAPAAAGGDAQLRSGHRPPPARQAGDDRIVAGQRAQRPVVGGLRSAGPALRRGLVADPGRRDLVEDGARRGQRARRLLTFSTASATAAR